MFEHDGMSEYERQRAENIRQNEAMLASLGLSSGMSDSSQTNSKGRNLLGFGKKTSTAARGLKRAPRKRRPDPVPTRRSSRQRGEAADDVYITSESAGKVTVAGWVFLRTVHLCRCIPGLTFETGGGGLLGCHRVCSRKSKIKQVPMKVLLLKYSGRESAYLKKT